MACGHPLRLVEKTDHPRILGGQSLECVTVMEILSLELRRKFGQGAVQGAVLERAVDDLEQLIVIHGFGQVIEGSQFHGAHGKIHVGNAGQDDDRELESLVPHDL